MLNQWKRWCLWCLILSGLTGPVYADEKESIPHWFISGGANVLHDSRGAVAAQFGARLGDFDFAYERYEKRNIGSATYNILSVFNVPFRFNFGAAYWDEPLGKEIGTRWNFVLEPEFRIYNGISLLLTHYSHGTALGIAPEKPNKGVNLLKLRYHW